VTPNLGASANGPLAVSSSVLRALNATCTPPPPKRPSLTFGGKAMRNVRLDPVTFRSMRRRAQLHAQDGMEVCGVLISDELGTISLRALRNLSTVPAKWEIKRSWLCDIRSELRSTRRRLVGTFHSHVGGFAYPSEADLDYYPSGFLMMIYDTIEQRVGMWMPVIRGDEGRLKPIAVLCNSPFWDNDSAAGYASLLQQRFRLKEKRNQPNMIPPHETPLPVSSSSSPAIRPLASLTMPVPGGGL